MERRAGLNYAWRRFGGELHLQTPEEGNVNVEQRPLVDDLGTSPTVVAMLTV